jgi:hypothetical protein
MHARSDEGTPRDARDPLAGRLEKDGWTRCPACGAYAREGTLDEHRARRCLAGSLDDPSTAGR